MIHNLLDTGMNVENALPKLIKDHEFLNKTFVLIVDMLTRDEAKALIEEDEGKVSGSIE
jgi:NAD-dependent DNA ligase